MSSKPTSWRDVLPIHPAAELFPRMTEAEIAALGEDIKKNGLKSPIVLWSPGYPGEHPTTKYVLDGINRLDAMERVGCLQFSDQGPPIDLYDRNFQTKYEKYLSIADEKRRKKGEHVELPLDTDPYVFVISANLHRRHLTAEQRHDLIAKVLKATPEKSDRQIGEQLKADHKTIAKVRREKESTGELSPVEKRIGADRKARKQPAKKPRRTEDDFKRDVQAKKATATPGDIGPMLPVASPPVIESLKLRIGTAEDKGWGWNVIDEETGRIVYHGHTKRDAEYYVRAGTAANDAVAGKDVSAVAVSAKIEGVAEYLKESAATAPPVAPSPDNTTDERRIIAMIDDGSICKLIAKWGEGKDEKVRGKKAYRLVRSLIGPTRSDLFNFIQESKFGGAFSDEQWAAYDEDHPGKKISIEFGPATLRRPTS